MLTDLLGTHQSPSPVHLGKLVNGDLKAVPTVIRGAHVKPLFLVGKLLQLVFQLIQTLVALHGSAVLLAPEIRLLAVALGGGVALQLRLDRGLARGNDLLQGGNDLLVHHADLVLGHLKRCLLQDLCVKPMTPQSEPAQGSKNSRFFRPLCL